MKSALKQQWAESHADYQRKLKTAPQDNDTALNGLYRYALAPYRVVRVKRGPTWESRCLNWPDSMSPSACQQESNIGVRHMIESGLLEKVETN